MRDEENIPTIEELQEKYTFYLLNPDYTKGVEYSLWIDDGDREYPILSSNTGGFVTFNSKNKETEDGIQLTDKFFEMVRIIFNRSMSLGPNLYSERDHQVIAESVYNGGVRKYEEWLAWVLNQQFIHGDDLHDELKPIAEHAAGYSDCEMPAL